jgi:HPt (histidine-containing phosphotransfer) domain-containing protein
MKGSHALKGGALVLGFDKIGALAESVEIAGRGEVLGDSELLVGQIELELARLHDLIKEKRD